jgi:hypothetical protein
MVFGSAESMRVVIGTLLLVGALALLILYAMVATVLRP